jgi:hypothetical protein
MPLDPAQSRGVVQILSGSNQKIRVVLKDTQRRVAPFAQYPTNIVGVMAVVYCKLVLLEFEGIVTDSTIIPLKFQQKVIIAGGQPKPI